MAEESYEEYIEKALASFDRKMSVYFAWLKAEDKCKIDLQKLSSIHSILFDLSEIGKNVIVDIGNASFDYFSNAKKDEKNNLLKIVWYEQFDELEKRTSTCVEFKPEKMRLYYDAMRPQNNYIAIKANRVYNPLNKISKSPWR